MESLDDACFSDPQDDIARLLQELERDEMLDEVVPVLYTELRRLAHRHLHGQREGHTLNTTALVHEAYLKLSKLDHIRWKSRGQFFALATQAMRHILLNYARNQAVLKRGGGRKRVTLDENRLLTDTQAEQVLALDEALGRLKSFSERQYEIINFRFFGGLTIEETAEVLEISPATVKREWQRARAWLNRELKRNPLA